jgi:calcineurin-like phosphoesterase family protein
MMFFTADLHLGHKNIIKYCNRPFDNVDDMDRVIIDNINRVVGQRDQLFILGDFAFRGKQPDEYRSLIKARVVHIILGNHDKRGRFGSFSSVENVREISHFGQKVFLSHYPHRSWPSRQHGSWMLYGHVHGQLEQADRLSNCKTLDVCVDNCAVFGKPFGEPFGLAEIGEILASFRPCAG